jgi:hypothetical protein
MQVRRLVVEWIVFGLAVAVWLWWVLGVDLGG